MKTDKETQDILENKYALSNDLIRMPNSLSVNSLKFLGVILSKIDWQRENRTNKDFIEVETSISDLIKAFGSNSNNYEFYYKSIFELQDKAVITLDINKNIKSIGERKTFQTREEVYEQMQKELGRTLTKEEKRDINKQFLNVRRLQIFPDIWLDEEHNKIKVAINNRLNGFIELLSSNFTIFQIANTCNFKSRYAYVLYMNLCSWQDHSRDRKDQLDERQRYYTTKQLKEMFDMTKDDYVYNNHFQRTLFEKKAIDKAVEEINKYSNIRVEWHKEYKGSKVEKYVFSYFRTDTWQDANTGYFNY